MVQVGVESSSQGGGKPSVKGDSLVSTFIGRSSDEVTRPLSYAGGRALAIDGGIYDGGPCLIVGLDQR